MGDASVDASRLYGPYETEEEVAAELGFDVEEVDDEYDMDGELNAGEPKAEDAIELPEGVEDDEALEALTVPEDEADDLPDFENEEEEDSLAEVQLMAPQENSVSFLAELEPEGLILRADFDKEVDSKSRRDEAEETVIELMHTWARDIIEVYPEFEAVVNELIETDWYSGMSFGDEGFALTIPFEIDEEFLDDEDGILSKELLDEKFPEEKADDIKALGDRPLDGRGNGPRNGTGKDDCERNLGEDND
jgi:hypothetical protein